MTAEAVAELLKKPLYVVTAGDLGTTASELEKSLGMILLNILLSINNAFFANKFFLVSFN